MEEASIETDFAQLLKLSQKIKEWKFIPGSVSFKKIDSESLVQFQYKFDCASTSQVYFVYSFPFGYEDVCKQMNEFELKLKESKDIYFYREVAAYSIERRKVELITITDHSQKSDLTEPYIIGLSRGQ